MGLGTNFGLIIWTMERQTSKRSELILCQLYINYLDYGERNFTWACRVGF